MESVTLIFLQKGQQLIIALRLSERTSAACDHQILIVDKKGMEKPSNKHKRTVKRMRLPVRSTLHNILKHEKSERDQNGKKRQKLTPFSFF